MWASSGTNHPSPPLPPYTLAVCTLSATISHPASLAPLAIILGGARGRLGLLIVLVI